jgi:hypothetical protein
MLQKIQNDFKLTDRLKIDFLKEWISSFLKLFSCNRQKEIMMHIISLFLFLVLFNEQPNFNGRIITEK